MSNPLISVIIPVYNGQEFISGCLDSLLELDYPKNRFEIIVADNNSKDKTAEIVKEHPVRYILEFTKGAAAARNAGAKEAKGEILAFIDADVIVRKDWLGEIEKTFADNQNIDGVMGVRFGINKNIWAELFQRYYEIFTEKKKEEGDNLKCIDTANFSIRKKTFDEAKGFDEKFISAEDVEFGLRLYEMGKKIIFSDKIKVSHINPSDLEDIIRARREQTFYGYKISQMYSGEKRREFFPTLFKLRYKVIFMQNRIIEKAILLSLCALLPIIIFSSALILKLLRAVGLRKTLRPLFDLVMGFAMYHGNILARSVEENHLTVGQRLKKTMFKFG